jgi:hypothetical protein
MRRTLALALSLPLVLVLLAGGAPPTDGGPAAPSSDHLSVASAIAPKDPMPEDLLPPDASTGAQADGAAATAGAEGTIAGGDSTDPARPGTGPTMPSDATADRSDPVESSFLVAPVPAEGAVSGSGRRWRYSIEVEPTLGIDPAELAVEVRTALQDERSWSRTRTLEQVDDPAQARIRIVLASPETVDELCGRAGLRTAGIYSCWNGRFAALNSWRWEVGAEGFPDITTYRTYLVNHEFGHGLGFGHVGCPAEGAPAPVMMQQSKGLGACVANGWPYP